MNYSRITDSISIETLQQAHIVIVGAGGAYTLITSLARTGIGSLTVIDFDTVEDTNIVRQGYKQSDIGTYKVEAIEKEVKAINPALCFKGINKNLLDVETEELDAIFGTADLLLFLTDSFKAQAFGNILALRYLKPAVWAGWYAKSRTAEVFFQVPYYTKACFRCCASSRYKINESEEIKISSNSNTIFHSQLLDALIGMIGLAILNRYKGQASEDNPTLNEYEQFFEHMRSKDGTLEYNFFQFKAHPDGGNKLFKNAFGHLGMSAHNFNAYWQNVEAELEINGYTYDCPDCYGRLHYLSNHAPKKLKP